MRTMPGEYCIEGKHYSAQELVDFASGVENDEKRPAWEREVYRFIHNWLIGKEKILQHSSGTTGISKEIKLSRNSMITSARNTCRYFDLRKGNTALMCLPVEYIAGKMMIVRAFSCGLNLLLTEPKSKPVLPDAPKVDFCAMVPLQVANLLDSGYNLTALQNLIIGGAEISFELENRLKELPVQAYATYGMAETCSHVALRKISAPAPQPDYHALPGVELSVDDRGCLVITADYLPETIVTNDLAELTGPGSFRWIGRFDNLINSGGVKVVPEELELRIREMTGQECAVIGLPDRKLGQKLVLVIEKSKDPTREIMIMDELKLLLPHKLQPKEIIGVEKFPRNPALKLDRRRLTKMVCQKQ